MTEKLKEITAKVNNVLGTNFNTILLNKYKDGEDCIGYHRDNEAGWKAAVRQLLRKSIWILISHLSFMANS